MSAETRLDYWLRTGHAKGWDKSDPLLKKYATSRNGHATFAPSSSAMWLGCSGSLLANAGASDDAGKEAAYGTVAHHVAERWNKLGKKPVKLLGRKESATAGGNVYEFEIDDRMMELVEEYIDWCAEVPGDHFYEQRVDLSPIMPIPDQEGTADHFACWPGNMVITDLKTGSGVRVFAEGNTQAQLYALGVFFEWDWIYRFETIVIRICQPPLDVFETWTITRKELLDFARFAEERALAAWNEKATRSPSGKACKWCRVAVPCPARLRELEDLIDDTFDGLDEDERKAVEVTPDKAAAVEMMVQDFGSLKERMEKVETLSFPELSTSVLSYTLTFRKQIEDWFGGIADELLKRAENGEKLPHFSLKDGRHKYFWKGGNNKHIAKGIATMFDDYNIAPEDLFAPAKLRTPNDAKKLLRAETGLKPKELDERLSGLIGSMAGKRTLAPLTDDRPDVSDLADDTFDSVENDEL